MLSYRYQYWINRWTGDKVVVQCDERVEPDDQPVDLYCSLVLVTAMMWLWNPSGHTLKLYKIKHILIIHHQITDHLGIWMSVETMYTCTMNLSVITTLPVKRYMYMFKLLVFYLRFSDVQDFRLVGDQFSGFICTKKIPYFSHLGL